MKEPRARLRLVPLALLLAAPACSNGSLVNIGQTQLSSNAAPDGDAVSALAALAGVWEGSTDFYSNQSTLVQLPSMPVRLVLDKNGNGAVMFGDAPSPPPAVDPNVLFPFNTDLTSFAYYFWEGLTYPVHAPLAGLNTIHLGLNPSDTLKPWCQLQGSYPLPVVSPPDASTVTTAYGCLPGLVNPDPGAAEHAPTDGSTEATCSVVLPDGGLGQTYDCHKFWLCTTPGAGLYTCVCDADGCASQTIPDGTLAVDYPAAIGGTISDNGTNFIGAVTLPNDEVLSLQLTRTQQ